MVSNVGKRHIKTAKSLYLKGNLQLRCIKAGLIMIYNKKDLHTAENLIRESLEINKEIVGEHYLETADCYHSLGKIKA